MIISQTSDLTAASSTLTVTVIPSQCCVWKVEGDQKREIVQQGAGVQCS